MTLRPSPPRTNPRSVKRGDTGWVVYAVQRGVGTTPDGVFGPVTETKTKEFQLRSGLKADGVAGANTQEAISVAAIRAVERQVVSPVGLLRGLALSESGMSLGAVNWTVAGGVDCSLVQRRVYGPPFSIDRLKDAFDPAKTVLMAATDLHARAKGYGGGERGWRLAALAHNWPAGADDIARDGRLTDADGDAPWVPPGLRWPDGVPVRSRLDWCRFYALGGPHGEGMVCRFVENWSVSA